MCPLDLAKRTTLIISKAEMENVMKIIKFLEKLDLLIKDVNKIIGNEVKEQKGGFIGMSLSSLGVSLFGSLLSSKGVI